MTPEGLPAYFLSSNMSLVPYIALKRTKLHFSLKRELFVLTNLYIAVSMTFSFLTFSKFIGAQEWRAGQVMRYFQFFTGTLNLKTAHVSVLNAL